MSRILQSDTPAFYRAMLEDMLFDKMVQSDITDQVRLFESTYNCKFIPPSQPDSIGYDIEFDTDQDLSWFLLKWS